VQRPREATPPDGFAEFVAARSDALLRSAWLLTGDGSRAEAAAAGCSQNWKNVLPVETAGNHARSGTLPEPFPSGQQVRLCVYQVPSSDPGTGNFVHGTVLPADRRTAVDHLLRAAGPAEPCGTHAGRFALLQPVTDGGPPTYGELDGCHRIMADAGRGGPVLAQGDAALAELLDQPGPAGQAAPGILGRPISRNRAGRAPAGRSGAGLGGNPVAG
jgi:hypothetical protein